MDKPRILLVDDDALFRDSVEETLKRQGYEVDSARNGTDAVGKFQNGEYDLVISDLKMPVMSGIELLEKIRKVDPDVPFLVVTAYGDIETAVEAMQKGAYSFLQKSPSMNQELELTVGRTLQYRSLMRENRRLRTELQKKFAYIGTGDVMQKIRDLVESVAPSRSTVLISGESGTGKELVARSIHYLSPRQEGPFVKVNCAALPEGLIESELFGHEKGSFTGALKAKRGKFELASGGTLLLDEIGEMSSNVQAKLLRVLQEKEITRVGGDDSISVDVRVVATTNRDLHGEVDEGRFREDLYYRINVFHINLPPLKERREDIAALVEHFIRKYNDENGFSVDCLEDGGLELLVEYDWPGNIRELENAVERAVVLTRTGKISAGHFDFSRRQERYSSVDFEFKPGISIADAEKELIFRTLESCGQNRTRAAEMLGISIRTLRNKLHEYAGEPG